MFGEKAYELIKELDRNSDNITPFNVKKNILFFVCIQTNIHDLYLQDENVRQVLDEIQAIFTQNHTDA